MVYPQCPPPPTILYLYLREPRGRDDTLVDQQSDVVIVQLVPQNMRPHLQKALPSRKKHTTEQAEKQEKRINA